MNSSADADRDERARDIALVHRRLRVRRIPRATASHEAPYRYAGNRADAVSVEIGWPRGPVFFAIVATGLAVASAWAAAGTSNGWICLGAAALLGYLALALSVNRTRITVDPEAGVLTTQQRPLWLPIGGWRRLPLDQLTAIRVVTNQYRGHNDDILHVRYQLVAASGRRTYRLASLMSREQAEYVAELLEQVAATCRRPRG